MEECWNSIASSDVARHASDPICLRYQIIFFVPEWLEDVSDGDARLMIEADILNVSLLLETLFNPLEELVLL